MLNAFSKLYDRIVLGHPIALLIVLSVILGFFSYQAKNFKLDASSDSLVLEDDKDFKIFSEISERYAIQPFLVVAFTPYEDLFSEKSLQRIRELRETLKQLERVDSVITILDVPLLKTSDVKLSEISAKTVKSLENPGIDKTRARQELTESPIYSDLIISTDGQTTALIINLKRNEYYENLVKNRNYLLSKQREGTLSSEERSQLQQYAADYEKYNALNSAQRHQDIEKVRSIIGPYKQFGVVHLGGVPMIADDMISFIKSDLVIFGFGVFAFIVVTLTVIFREVRWVILPLLNSGFAVLFMIGMLGFLNWKVTVISSNFISLMIILTISMNIHLAGRYQQLCRDLSSKSQVEIVATTARKMVWPCLYTALTTIMAFSSLVLSGIRPVIDFGWMMTIGLSVTFFSSFLLFPSVLVLLKKSKPKLSRDGESKIVMKLARVAEFHGGKVIALSLLFACISVIGILNLRVENSFINYFSKSTEIYQGMKLIDEKLGGTNPLDIVLRFKGQEESIPAGQDVSEDGEDDFLEEDEFSWVENYDPKDYWFTPYKIERIKEVDHYLEGLPEVGKVLSLASVIWAVEELNDEKPFDGLEMGVIYKRVPEELKVNMLDPFVSFDKNETRLSLRIIDSLKDIRRKELIEKINRDLITKLGFAPEDVTVSGILVLYNNMLQSLFRSQILTLGIVMLGIGIMLFTLFRSFALAVIGLVPNLIAVGVVLGIMGLLNIPLDMMTITIAAITMGIGVDNCIHYIYRFKEEFPKTRSYVGTVRTCHRHVGKAILNTSITITFGFSILVFSKFIPTIYFGIFTGLAMMVALVAVLTLMPKVILMWKPFKG